MGDHERHALHTACRISFDERLTTFLFMAHSSSQSMMAFWKKHTGHRRRSYSSTLDPLTVLYLQLEHGPCGAFHIKGSSRVHYIVQTA